MCYLQTFKSIDINKTFYTRQSEQRSERHLKKQKIKGKKWAPSWTSQKKDRVDWTTIKGYWRAGIRLLSIYGCWAYKIPHKKLTSTRVRVKDTQYIYTNIYRYKIYYYNISSGDAVSISNIVLPYVSVANIYPQLMGRNSANNLYIN